MSNILSAGYNVDFIDAQAIDRLGIHHPILVIPPTDRIPVTTLRKIQQYVAAGGKVISVGRAPSRGGDGKITREFTSLATTLFDSAKHTFVAEESQLADALHQAQAPDMKVAATDASTRDAIGFIRRKLPSSDIYFVANTSNHPVHTSVSFVSTHQFGEQWDPDTTASQSALSKDGELTLAPFESRVFVFSDTPVKTAPKAGSADTKVVDLSGDWNLKFTGTGKSQSEAKLTDWIADPATKNYSGEAVYTQDFTLAAKPTQPTYLQVEGGSPLAKPGEEVPVDTNTTCAPGAPLPNPLVTRTGPGMRAWFDPPIHEAAIVLINDQRVGSLWHPPYRLDVSSHLKAGTNHIEIRVYNTAINAWAALPPHDYKPLIAQYGDRFQMQDLDKVQPVSSGLLGKISLVTEQVSK